jgi:hypothetical protein
MTEVKDLNLEQEVKEQIAYHTNRYNSNTEEHILAKDIDLNEDLDMYMDSLELAELGIDLEVKYKREDIYDKLFEKNDFTGKGLIEIISS